MMATKSKNNNDNIVVVSGPSTGICPHPLDGTTDNTDDKVTTLVTTEPPVLMALNAANAQITKLTHDLSQQQRRQQQRQQKDRTLIEHLRQEKEEAESRNHSLEVVASNADRRVTRLEKEKQKLENTVESLISSGERLRKAKKNNEDHYVFLIESLRQANHELEEQLLKQTKINDGRVEELPILMLTGLDVAAIMLLMTYIANHGAFHNGDEYGGALLFDDEYAESESLGGQLGLSAGQLGLSNKERLPGSRRPVSSSSSSSSSSSTGNDDEQVTAMVTTGPQIMLTGLYMATLCKLETNEDGGSTTKNSTISLSTISINLFDFLTALLLLRPLYYFNPAIGVRIVSTRKEENSVNLLDLPFSLLTSPTDSPLSYLDSASIRTVSLLNKKCRGVVRGPGIHLSIPMARRLFPLSPEHPANWAWMEELFSPRLRITTSGERENNHGRLVQQLFSNREKLQNYTEAAIIDVNQFDNFDDWRDAPYFWLRGLESLTISSTSPPPPRPNTIVRGSLNPLLLSLQTIMPNIQRINFTGANFSSVNLRHLWSWPRLTKITWNGIGISDHVRIRGGTFALLHNLREMYTDDSYFHWDLFRRPDQFIFHACCQNLERLSIRNARYYKWGSHTLSSVPQQELIKFVRNAPSLKWFRSDLTLDNIAMLQKERPGIELLS